MIIVTVVAALMSTVSVVSKVHAVCMVSEMPGVSMVSEVPEVSMVRCLQCPGACLIIMFSEPQ